MSVILQKWQHKAQSAEALVILPDGCRDFIWHERPGQPSGWVLTDLQANPIEVRLEVGVSQVGLRLHPGAFVPNDLLREMPDCADAGAALVAQAIEVDGLASHAIEALSSAKTVKKAANALGVSERSLHRLVKAQTGRSPAFWLRLARARRAGAALGQWAQGGLADMASAFGFADQAHMSREFRYWFGQGPRTMRQDPDVLAQLSQPALCTGEQISTRNPLISLT